MAQIERDLLAEKPLEALLRKLILLGGNAGSAELRDWAAAELRGYRNGDELPHYRKVNAPIQIDRVVSGGVIKHQTISTMDLPDFVDGELDELVPLTMGVRELRAMIEHPKGDRAVQLTPPGAALVVRYMNGTGGARGQITALYWTVSSISVVGVLDQIRTRLAELIAELRSSTPQGQMLPSAVQAANAVNFVINGHGNRVNIAQAADSGTATTAPADTAPGSWTRARIVGAAVVGLATIVGTGIAALQLAL
ncbi:hypothetical protein ARHIZOSPH14_06720 [Agromyces rhizosphaerae]|uniref:AbiTii domain-containing protein n=1 Tax=Agromyces rhizosphaerae TaxID=88374 RepID=A0A9W6FNH3_9MICO|nr:hypothetical protein [Agromyces rhizosphaerae]GLI26430.1 hypothetical protein ARHIZOSPH14_06720 [Agromyces rhizosphaerae]